MISADVFWHVAVTKLPACLETFFSFVGTLIYGGRVAPFSRFSQQCQEAGARSLSTAGARTKPHTDAKKFQPNLAIMGSVIAAPKIWRLRFGLSRKGSTSIV